MVALSGVAPAADRRGFNRPRPARGVVPAPVVEYARGLPWRRGIQRALERGRTMVGDRHNVAFMVGVILGALAAALAVLFLTPVPGRDTREQLAARLAGLRGESEEG